MTVFLTIVAALLALYALLITAGIALQGKRLRRLHTPGGVGTIAARIDADGYQPARSVVYCRDCRSPHPCPTLAIYGIKA